VSFSNQKIGFSSFFVQAGLVFLPVVLLAGIGFWFLAQDRDMAHREAAQIAEDLGTRAAREIAINAESFFQSKMEERLFDSFRTNFSVSSFPARFFMPATTLLPGTISRDGVESPPALLPIDWDASTVSTSSASAFYQQAQTAEFQNHDLGLAAHLYDEAAQAAADGSLQSLALYGAGCAFAALNRMDSARERFSAITHAGKGALEHIVQLAQFRLITLPGKIQNKEITSQLLTRIIAKPTLLSPELLKQLNALAATNGNAQSEAGGIELADFVLNQNLRARRLGELILKSANEIGLKNGGWPVVDGIDYIVLKWPGENGGEIFCGIPRNMFSLSLNRFAHSLQSVRVPPHFKVDAHTPYSVLAYSTGTHPSVMATNIATISSSVQIRSPRGISLSAVPFVTSVSLVDAAAYYHGQNVRRNLFYVVILCASLVSALGFAIMRAGFRRLERINELKNNFVASVSHEFRAPVASVRLLAENLERRTTPDPVRQHEYFKLIVQECDRLGNLIENLLSFSRQERGQARPVELKSIDLIDLVTQAVAVMQPIAQKRGIVIKSQVDASAELSKDPGVCILEPKGLERAPVIHNESSHFITILGDSRALTQVLLNLLDNALKFSPPQSPVEVLCSNLRIREIDCAAISIRDSGQGIDPREFQRIFEPFYRIGSEMTRETAGVGIGLSLVKQIVSAHNGGIYLRTIPGQGSTFTILFLRAAEKPTNDPANSMEGGAIQNV
jgi:signal transduction histidine kinase